MAKDYYQGIDLNISDAIPLIIHSLKVGLRPMIWGSYGVGKSSIVQKIAQVMGYDSCITIYPSQDDVLDYKLPYFVDTGDGKKKATFAISDRLPREGRHLIFVDEINTAQIQVQPTLYSLMLDGRISDYYLPEGCGRIAAGNREFDQCAANPMSAALKNRMAPHINITPDHKSWCSWAFTAGIRPEVISFIKDMPQNLEAADPDDPCGGATPRGLENLSKLLSENLPPHVEAQAIRGTIGFGPGQDFIGHLQIFRNSIDIEKILENPKKAPIPDKPSVVFAVATSLAYRLINLKPNTPDGEKILQSILDYLVRLEASYCVWVVEEARTLNKHITMHPDFKKIFNKCVQDNLNTFAGTMFGLSF